MAAIILIPAFACWAILAWGSARKALLYVYLPALLLVPQYYVFRLPHLPPLSAADAAVLPLGIALAFTWDAALAPGLDGLVGTALCRLRRSL